MRCIEIPGRVLFIFGRGEINRNMRCIEMASHNDTDRVIAD